MSDFKYALNEQIQIAGACNGTVIKRLTDKPYNRYKIDAVIDKYSGWYRERDLIPCDLKTVELVKLTVIRETQL